jgi:hypothetical protein
MFSLCIIIWGLYQSSRLASTIESLGEEEEKKKKKR